MKTKIKLHFLICLSVLFSLCFSTVYTQVINDDYNVFVQATGYWFTYDHNGSSTNYPRFSMEIDPDGGDLTANCDLVGWDGSGYEHFWSWAADTPSSNYAANGKKVLYNQNNVSTPYYDFTFTTWDENGCSSVYRYNTGCESGIWPFITTFSDKNRHKWCMFRDIRQGSSFPGSYYEPWDYISGDSNKPGIRTRRTWRYAKGRSTDPLDFGALTYGNRKFHSNWNNGPASGSDNDMGYHDDWKPEDNGSFSNDRDVTYRFTVDNASYVTIETDWSSTDFDTKVHLVRWLGSDNFEYITSNSDVSAGNAQSSLTQGIPPGTYYAIVEGENGESGEFQVSVVANEIDFTEGSISHSRPWIEPGCTLTMPIASVDAYVSVGDVNYSWEKKDTSTNLWEIIPGAVNATLTGPELGSLLYDTDIRRVATSYNWSKYSNPLSFAVTTTKSNGKISGKVTGPGGVNMSGVTIYAEISNSQGQCPGHIYETTTDGSGQYILTELYYGLNTASDTIPDVNFRVWAEFFTHDFNPMDHNVTLNTITPEKTGYDFVDEEAVFISGHVTQTDPRSELQETCGVPDANFNLNSLLQTQYSDALGQYDLPVITFGDNTVEPFYLNHTFSPSSIEIENVVNDVSHVDFDDTTTNTITGSVRACGGFGFGAVELLFQDEANCFMFKDTTDNIGDFSIDLPARKYTVQVTDTDLDDTNLSAGYDHNAIADYFAEEIYEVDIDTSDVNIYLQYRQLPIVTIGGLTANTCGDIVVEQGVSQMLQIQITEPNTANCPVDTGLVKIVNAISGLENTVIEIPFSNGYVEYELTPGEPKITGDFKLGFTVTAYSIAKPNLKKIQSFDAIVVGNNARESTFTTVSPEVPLMILRDPPGDGSYSYLEQNQSSEMSIGFSALSGGSVNVWSKAKVGAAFSTEFFGVGIESSAWGELSGSTTVDAYNVSQTEAVMKITNGTRFETSSENDPNVMGEGGDIYIGAALNIHYALTDIVEYNETTCMVEQSVEVIMGSDIKEETQFRYTDYFIRTAVIPDLELLMSLSTDQDEIDDYQNQIAMWNQTLELNYNLKERATDIDTFPTDISWSGATNSELFTETSSSYTSSFEFFADMETEIAAEAGYEVAGSGASGGVSVKLRVELGESSSSTNMLQRKTGFVLSDSDPDDGFNTLVKMCPTYNTPTFENIAGFTSCPREEGTLPIDFPYLEVDNPVQLVMNASGSAGFNFELTNLSQKQLTRSYYIDVVENSNPYGAIIDPGGAGFPLLISDIAYNQTVTRFFSIARNPANTVDYSLEGIQFIAYPAECSDDQQEIVTSYTTVSVYFDAPCSDMTLAEPQDGWIHNTNAGDSLELRLRFYDKAQLNNVKIQYSPAGLNSWLDAVTLLPADLEDNATAGTYVKWGLTNVEDDDYDIRVRVNCTGATVYTPRVTGVVDRVAPVVFGIPEPVDDHYDPNANDQLSVSFEEEIDCTNAVAMITDLETDQVLSATTSCAGNTLIVTPNVALNESIYRVTVTGVEDVFQNERDAYEWVFITGNYVFNPDCSSVEISNNNLNQNAISQSTYVAMQISSDGLVAQSTTITFLAEESVDLNGGFEVEPGAIFIAEIEDCEE